MMSFDFDEMLVLMKAIDRALARWDSEVRYAKDGRGKSNAETVSRRIEILRGVRRKLHHTYRMKAGVRRDA